MNKAELIQTISATNDLSKVEATKIVSIFIEQMARALENGDRVEIRGLCSFYVNPDVAKAGGLQSQGA